MISKNVSLEQQDVCTESLIKGKSSKKMMTRGQNFIVAAFSVARLGDFRKFLATTLLATEAQMIGNFWAILKTSLLCKTALTTFWATFGKIRLLFTPKSGHTGARSWHS